MPYSIPRVTAVSDLAEIRAVLYELKEDVGAGRADIASLRDSIKERQVRIDAIEERQRKVENRQHWYSGATAVVSGFLAWYIPGLKLPHM